MKGYFTANGYMGLINGHYILFSDESDYFEYYSECYIEHSEPFSGYGDAPLNLEAAA